jgi:alkanesulfonate monooxygenase SsuD/methylene tetrahydromethanopterin reductase-like flavin-dependent oxidoreductase (luciferase family)
MKVNLGITALNTHDWDRFEAQDWSRPPVVPDHYIWDRLVEMGDLAEPLGFDGIWVAEHFATPYCMTPNPLQVLSYFAARTERISMGTMVVVLPWWHPVQLAHEIAHLDILLKGRPLQLGFGRGVAHYEFEPIGLPMEQTRQRFVEGLDVLRLALTQERFSYDGEIFKIPETSIRPRPRSKDILDRAMGAFTTPESMEVIARRGLDPLMVGAKPLSATRADTARFNQIRQEVGLPPTHPKQLVFAYCTPKPDDRGPGYFQRYTLEAAQHYGLNDRSRFDGIKGYESYAARTSEETEGHRTDWLDNSLIGTPDVVLERAVAIQEAGGFDEIAVVFNFGGMDFEDSMRSLRLFAREVLPTLQQLPPPPYALPEEAELASVATG